MTPLALGAALLLATAPAGGERLAVLAVHEPPAPDGELSELAHQLRAAAGDRVAGVLSAPELRDRLAGRSGGATVQELDRAFGGALAVYQNGELESAARTLKAIVDDLEDLPENEAVWSQWTRAMARLSHVYLSLKQPEELEATQIALLKVDSTHQLDPVLYAPGFRARFEEVRQRVRAMPKRRLTVTARGRGGTIYVSGRDVGPTPATVILPAGIYRVGGAAGSLRIPSFTADLAAEDRAVVLDFALAEAFRPSAGPGMLLPPGERAGAIIRAGAWLGVERLLTASRSVEGGAQFLVGAIYDVRRGALLREGSVRMISGGVPPTSLGALASFLLTGQTSREVQDRLREPPRPASPRPLPPVAVVAAPPPPAAAAFIGHPAAHAIGAAARTAQPPAHAVQPAAPATATPAPVPVPASALASAPAASAAPPAPTAPTAPTAPHAAARRPGSGPATSVVAAVALPSAATPPSPAVAAETVAPAHPALPAQPPGSSGSTATATSAQPPPPPDLHPRLPAEDAVATALPGLRAPALPGPAASRPPPRWLRPTAIGSGILAALLGGLAVQQGLSARSAWRDADAMVLPGGALRPGVTPAGHDAALDRGDAAYRNAWIASGGAVLSGAASGLLFWMSRDPAPAR